MKNKHNKKRNTAFLYEILVREVTKAVVSKDNNKKIKATSIIKKYFKKGSSTYEELQLYKSLMDTTDLDEKISDKLLAEVKISRQKIDNKKLFNEQTKLIENINQDFETSIYSNFIPNYKNLANIFQMFNPSSNIKDKVMLEQMILDTLQSKTIQEEEKLDNIDNLVFKTFVGKFNDAYSEQLSEEQKKLVTNYVFSFSDNGVGIKTYLNEEISRLKEQVKKSLTLIEVKKDSDMVRKTKSVLDFLDSFVSKQELSESDVQKLLKIQMLVGEVSNDGN
tara:strand:+ start:143 stop:976 length:834 start_codon:yes stop_codon:yes gene_type:complete